MLNITVCAVGSLKEPYLKAACAEYMKRLCAYSKPAIVEIKEARLPDSPSEGQTAAALEDEGKRMLAAAPERAYKIALCVEGRQLSSPELAAALEEASLGHSSVAFFIGSSFGLSDSLKKACDLRLSFSKLTFPHQLMRVILLEAVYRARSITAGAKYHK